MNVPIVSDLVGIVNKIAPQRYAEGWDNPGLQVGDPCAQVKRIMVALDALPASVDAAISQRCNLLLTHHPLIFKPLKKLSSADPNGSLLFRAIRNDLAIVALHTNYDIADGGVNDLLAERLGLLSAEPLQITGSEELVKLCVFVPLGHEEQVMEALFRFSGFIGNYADCSFRVAGTGTFRPLDGATPFIGEKGERASVEENRVEVLLRKADTEAAVAALKKVHPYEEPAFDLYPLANRGAIRGLGRIGELAAATTLGEFAQEIKQRLGASGLRFVGDPERKIRRVALCGGSGASLLRDAHFRGADVLVTGDIKYHEARDAEGLGMALVDAGHFATERLMVQGLADRMTRELERLRYEVETIPFTGERDPFRYM